MIKYRLDFAKNYLEDAVELFNKGSFNSSASRAYYASYQAMWAALGEPEDGKIWRHLAIIKHFVRDSGIPRGCMIIMHFAVRSGHMDPYGFLCLG